MERGERRRPWPWFGSRRAFFAASSFGEKRVTGHDDVTVTQCPDCGATGRHDGRICSVCTGDGVVITFDRDDWTCDQDVTTADAGQHSRGVHAWNLIRNQGAA